MTACDTYSVIAVNQVESELKKFENKYNNLIKNVRNKEKTQELENFQNFIINKNKKIEYSNIDIILENKTLIDLKKEEVLKVTNRFNKRLKIEEIRISKNIDNDIIENTLNTLNTINTRLFSNLSRIDNEIKDAAITIEFKNERILVIGEDHSNGNINQNIKYNSVTQA